jgi:hypothetical protein
MQGCPAIEIKIWNEQGPQLRHRTPVRARGDPSILTAARLIAEFVDRRDRCAVFF